MFERGGRGAKVVGGKTEEGVWELLGWLGSNSSVGLKDKRERRKLGREAGDMQILSSGREIGLGWESASGLRAEGIRACPRSWFPVAVDFIRSASANNSAVCFSWPSGKPASAVLPANVCQFLPACWAVTLAAGKARVRKAALALYSCNCNRPAAGGWRPTGQAGLLALIQNGSRTGPGGAAAGRRPIKPRASSNPQRDEGLWLQRQQSTAEPAKPALEKRNKSQSVCPTQPAPARLDLRLSREPRFCLPTPSPLFPSLLAPGPLMASNFAREMETGQLR